MRKNLAERQARMKEKLLAARQTFHLCAFRSVCENEKIEAGPEFCERCTPKQLQQLMRSVKFVRPVGS